MPSSVKEMLTTANATVSRIQPAEVSKMMRSHDVLIVDVRDPTEVQASGKIKGAINVSRGMLEFRADPDSQYHNPAFRRDKRVVLYCGSGGRAALSGKVLQEMGYKAVFNAGGFKELVDAGMETEAG
jgi:rhodanese-related sulfurtransferase